MSRNHNYSRKLRLESLEERRLLATVTNLNDSGSGSLRDAINTANAISGPETIDIVVTGTINLNSTLEIIDDLVINGPGADQLTINGQLGSTPGIDGDGWRVFDIDDLTFGTIAVEIRDLTITGGDVTIDGGGIRSYEDLTLERVTVEGNYGGGVFVNDGQLTVKESTFFDNTSGDYGAGVFLFDGSAEISNSTFSGNITTQDGGGIYNDSPSGTLTVNNSTFSDNGAVNGGAIYTTDFATGTTINNNILANSVGAIDDVDGPGAYSGTHNLIETGSVSGLTNTVTGDPGLGALAFNGGTTQTHALSGGPAMDAGNATLSGIPATDQRGESRIAVSGLDLGAFELQESSSAPEDLNNDGYVDGLDLGVLLGSWLQSVGPEFGEFTGTPPVDGLDLGILLGAWNPQPFEPEGEGELHDLALGTVNASVTDAALAWMLAEEVTEEDAPIIETIRIEPSSQVPRSTSAASTQKNESPYATQPKASSQSPAKENLEIELLDIVI